MLKTFKSGKRLCCEFKKLAIQRRTFLSDAYRCEAAWNNRLELPLLQKVVPENLFLTLEQKHTTTGKISAIDIDIFANTVKEKFQVEELLSLIYNLRMTAEASNILDSTHHAVIKYLLNNDFTEELINILHDRLNYGIFPDHFCYNILMDTYVKKKDYASAAKIAVLPMLQEDSDNPITNALSTYCCHKYLETPEIWLKPPVVEEDSKEEIKVRVAYIKNPYFDDHFDLTDPRDLVGKTLAFQGKLMNDTLGRTCQLRGLILYKKYADISGLIDQWMKEVKEDMVHKEVFDLIKKDNEGLSEEQQTDEFKSLMSKVEAMKTSNLCNESLTQAVEKNVQDAVEVQSQKDITEQLRTYDDWNKQRQEKLNKQIEDLDKQRRIKTVEEMKKDLTERERLLTFFECEEQIEMELEEKEKKENEEMERLLKYPINWKKFQKLVWEGEYEQSFLDKYKKDQK